MKAIQFSSFGAWHDVVEVVELPEPTPPGPGEVLIDILAAPINPSDFLNFQGHFGYLPPPLPLKAGGEAVGVIAEVGAGVEHLRVGDRVLALHGGRGNWCQRTKASAAGLDPLPEGADTLQLAMTAINPATAWHMLKRFVRLAAGDWVLQNAGNSGVGHSVIQLARDMGIRTVSVVRRDEQVRSLLAKGSDAVVVDGPDLPQQVARAVEGAPIKLAFDAVAGEATARLGRCLANSGTIVTYGLLSGPTCSIDASDLVFRDVALRGFWFTHWFETTPPAARQEVYQDIGRLIADGRINVDVEAVYPMVDVKDALEHAARTGRMGKILLLPNPDLISAGPRA